VKRCVSKHANIQFEDKRKWNALIWASCKNYLDVVRYLLSLSAASIYATAQEEFTKKCFTGVINNTIKPSPLLWSCYKGNLNIVWLLLHAGCSWESVDIFGNNCLHVAGSGGDLPTFKCLLQLGVDIDLANSRGHTVQDLATKSEVLRLISQHKEATRCEKCLELFGKLLKKSRCCTCARYFCYRDYRLSWMFERHDSAEAESPEGRCVDCWQAIDEATEQLKMRMNDY